LLKLCQKLGHERLGLLLVELVRSIDAQTMRRLSRRETVDGGDTEARLNLLGALSAGALQARQVGGGAPATWRVFDATRQLRSPPACSSRSARRCAPTSLHCSARGRSLPLLCAHAIPPRASLRACQWRSPRISSEE